MNKTDMAISIFDKWASAYQEKFMDVSTYHLALDAFCERLPQGGRVLDMACGPGNLSRYVLDQRPDVQVLGIDLADNMLDLARVNNPSADFQRMDCRDILALDVGFSGVLCGFALPYLDKAAAVELVGKVGKLLRGGGVFFLSTMEDAYEKSGFEGGSTDADAQVFTHYHETAYLLPALAGAGLEVMDMQRHAFEVSEKKTNTDLVILAQKREVTA